jgi:hypothetical protein
MPSVRRPAITRGFNPEFGHPSRQRDLNSDIAPISLAAETYSFGMSRTNTKIGWPTVQSGSFPSQWQLQGIRLQKLYAE